MSKHLIRQDSFLTNITERKIEEEEIEDNRDKSYLDQTKEKNNIVSYQEVKVRALNKNGGRIICRQKLLNAKKRKRNRNKHCIIFD